MNRRTVRWTKRALARLDYIGATIAKDNPEAAANVVARIYPSAEALADHPAMGRNGRIMGTRELVITALPYIIPYRVTASSVDIITVMHAAQKWPQKL
jgi:addiction module RelE/StbE family toxin